jgi:hypothetical protein
VTWPELLGRLRAVGFRTATGVLRYRLPNRESVREGEVRFWHQPVDRWRVEDERGVWHLADGHRQLVRRDDQLEDFSRATVNFGRRHPTALFGSWRDGVVRLDWLKDFPAPDGPGDPVEVAGRRAWEFAFPAVERKRANKPHPLRVTLDGATGTVLRLAVPEAGYVVELVRFEPDVDLPEDVFRWDGPVSTRHADEVAESRRVHRWLDDTDLPTPRWWPRGFDYHGGDGDPETGAYRITLAVAGFPDLCRWPAGTAMPETWRERLERRHVHRWSDDRWEWALGMAEPLTETELARVVESFPPLSP